MTTLRPALVGELDEQTPATLRDLHPALASLLRGIERTQRSLLVGYGSRVVSSSVNWPGPGEAGTNVYRYPCRLPPGVSRVAFRLSGVNGSQVASGRVKITLDDGSGDHYTRVQLDYAPADFASRVERSTWASSSLRPATATFGANSGACIELAPVLEWRCVDFLVEVPEAAYVFAIEPLIAVDPMPLAPRRWGWGGDYAIQGGASLGLQVEIARNWAWREWRSVIVWVWLWAEPAGDEVLLAYGASGSDARTVLQLDGLVVEAETYDAASVLRRAVVPTVALTAGAWHQVILSWRQDVTTDAVCYIDGVASALTTNSASTPADLSAGLDLTALALHQQPTTLVGEIAELWGRVTADEATAAWGAGEPHDLRRTVLGRRVMDYVVAAAHDEDPVTGRARLYNLGREPSWQMAVLGAGSAVVQMGPGWLTGYLNCNGLVWAEAVGAMSAMSGVWSRVVVVEEAAGGYGLQTGRRVEIYRDDDTWTVYWPDLTPAEVAASGSDSGATGLRAVAATLGTAGARTLTWAGASTDGTGSDVATGAFSGTDITIASVGIGTPSPTGTRIYADLVIQGTPTVAQLRALLTTPPWQVFAPANILRCYLPALAYTVGATHYIPDVARQVGGPLPAVHAVMQAGTPADVVLA